MKHAGVEHGVKLGHMTVPYKARSHDLRVLVV